MRADDPNPASSSRKTPAWAWWSWGSSIILIAMGLLCAAGGLVVFSVILIATAIIVSTIATAGFTGNFPTREAPADICPACRFDLRGLPIMRGRSRCPECGADVLRSGGM
ncbi:MAG TPA: hypothetical protein VHN77_06520 [Phycisphaerales bacterium]|nr:hypothetical protein [Phycisphaerales bacterium]